MPDSELTPEQREAIRRTRQLCLWADLVDEHVTPKPDSILGLASRLKNWQEYFGKPQVDGLAAFEKIEEEGRFEIAQRFHQQQQRAQKENDYKLLHKISEAARLLATDSKLSHGLDVTGAAIYAFEELRQELGHRPHRDRIRERVEEWLGHSVSQRHWERSLQVLAPLYD
jgi:hypothetical protein